MRQILTCVDRTELLAELVLEEKELGANGAVLLKGQTYLIYCGKVRLPEGCRGCLSPKSSIGRVDVMVRGVVDGCGLYDIVPGDGKEREVWLEISPRSFNVRVHKGSAMTQLMLFMSLDAVLESEIPILDAGVGCSTPREPDSHDAAGSSMAAVNQSFEAGSSIGEDRHADMLEEESVEGGDEQQAWQRELESRICYDTEGKVLPLHLHKGALVLSVCIPGDHALLAGYEAVSTEEVIDLTFIASHDPRKFFRPIYSHGSSASDARLTLEKDRFYILATKERVSIPVHLSAEMVPFSHHVGELRAHYAGFFDPGFGFGSKGDLKGSIGVLEVRPHETINIYHGQPICLMEFFRNASPPKTPYGTGAVNSNYQGQVGSPPRPSPSPSALRSREFVYKTCIIEVIASGPLGCTQLIFPPQTRVNTTRAAPNSLSTSRNTPAPALTLAERSVPPRPSYLRPLRHPSVPRRNLSLQGF